MFFIPKIFQAKEIQEVKESKQESGRRVDLAGMIRIRFQVLCRLKSVFYFSPGDGTFDSPGFTAYYCTYYVLDLSTKKVLALWVATKEMVTNDIVNAVPLSPNIMQAASSAMMEPFAAEKIVLDLAHVIIY